MDISEIKPVGSPCGSHGPYTFYKAFKYWKSGVSRVVSLCEFFFLKLWTDSDLVCIGELQLLWQDRNSDQLLASLRLYFLPENTPDGRIDHGEDEVLAISEKVVLRLEDLLTWITVDTEWTWGRHLSLPEPPDTGGGSENEKNPDNPEILPSKTLMDNQIDFSDVEKEKKFLGDKSLQKMKSPGVIILSYPRYCRYRAIMRRLEGAPHLLNSPIVWALGGVANPPGPETRVMFCRDTFDYPELETHELLCNHLAPKLKGRPRGRKKKRSISPGSESGSDASVSSAANKSRLTSSKKQILSASVSTRRSPRVMEKSAEEKMFTSRLHSFLRSIGSPLSRTPQIGQRELDLHNLYMKVKKLGGYDTITNNKLWKGIADDIGAGITATILRRTYERLLLKFEKHEKGESLQDKRRKSKTYSESDASENDRTSSGGSTPVPSGPRTSSPHISNGSLSNKDQISKTTSLRHVRVKPVRENPVPKLVKEIPHTITSTTLTTLKTKENEPITSAVAPKIADQPVIEKSVSPLEGKENIPDIPNDKKNDVTVTVESGALTADDDVIEVPYKPPTPEIIDLDPDEPQEKNNFEVKKRKLDILKEGGLEVTAVASKDRPSVIQNSVGRFKHELGNLSITISPQEGGKRILPPQMKGKVTSLVGSVNANATLPQPQRKVATKDAPNVNGFTPPKVVQSRSIFNYSEKIVYGNPKDYFVQPQNVVIPNNLTLQNRKSIPDVLDLTVKSPQKPIVEIMKVPNITQNLQKRYQNNLNSQILTQKNHLPQNLLPKMSNDKPNLKNLNIDNRLGSNLEITLVSSSKPQNPPKIPQIPQLPQKRTSNGTIKSYKPETPKIPYSHKSEPKLQSDLSKLSQFHLQSPLFSPYMAAQLSAQSKMPMHQMPAQVSAYLPLIDPIYYSALCSQQNMGLNLPNLPSMPVGGAGSHLGSFLPQMPSVDQLALFKELMARGRLPFMGNLDGGDGSSKK